MSSILCVELWFLSSLRSAQRWMQSTAPYACWLPVPRGCRWSAVRPHPRSLGPPQWTTSSSLSRSSNAPTTLPRLLSSWSPSPLVRRNSDPTNTDGWMHRKEGERTDQCMGGLRGMGGASRRGRKRENMITLRMGGRGRASDRENDGRDEENLEYAWKWNRTEVKRIDCSVETLQRTERRRNSTSVEVKVGKDEWEDPTWKLQPAAT